MSAPKKIWTDPLFWHSISGTYTDHGVEIQRTPYIRADIVDELVRALNNLVDVWELGNEYDGIAYINAEVALARVKEEG